MKTLLTILLLTFSIGCQSQNTLEKTTAKKNIELKPPFKNQSEQEDYWAQELFKKEYKKTSYKIYTEKIERIGVSKFTYDNKSFNVFVANKDLELIFIQGILFPQLMSGFTSETQESKKELDSLSNSQRYLYEMARGDNSTIANLEELKFLSDSPKVKRFRFWLSMPKPANPQVYLFELTNDKADKNTSLKEFIKNSRLTFLKAGWIIL